MRRNMNEKGFLEMGVKDKNGRSLYDQDKILHNGKVKTMVLKNADELKDVGIASYEERNDVEYYG